MKLLLLILLLAPTVIAQDVCDLALSAAPTLRGLKLGETVRDVNAVLKPKTPLKLDMAPNKFLFIDLPQTPVFEGVFSIDIQFGHLRHDDKIQHLNDIRISYYDPMIEWDSLTEFVDAISSSLGLPRTAFKIERGNPNASLTCNGFILFATLPGEIRLMATTLIEDGKRIRTERKKAFKP